MDPKFGQARVRGWAFVPMVLAAIGTFAGLLLTLSSLSFLTGGDAQPALGTPFNRVWLLAVALTVVSGLALFDTVNQIRGHTQPRSTRLLLFLVAAAVLGAALILQTAWLM